MPVDVPAFFASSKSLTADLNWVVTPERHSFEAPLEVDGMSLAGARVRGTVRPGVAQPAVMLQLELISSSNRVGGLDRLDWHPIHVHDNQGKGPLHLRFVKQNYSHHHQFELNWLETEQRLRAGNLPIAIPFEHPLSSINQVFEFAEQYFKISGLGRHQMPEWQEDMFRSPR